MSLWRRTRALEDGLERLCSSVHDHATATDSRIAALERTIAELTTGLARAQAFADELEQRVRDSAAKPVPAVLDIAPAATFDGEQHHDDPDQAPEPEPEPAAEELQLTDEQAALVAAVNELGEAMTGEIAAHVGRADQPDAVGMALKRLRARGLVSHNGRRAKGARWLALSHEPAPPPPATADPLDVSALDERIIRLVEQHGPCTHVYVADNLVKNRRETGARMRELARNGLLVDLDGAFATPDLADAA